MYQAKFYLTAKDGKLFKTEDDSIVCKIGGRTGWFDAMELIASRGMAVRYISANSTNFTLVAKLKGKKRKRYYWHLQKAFDGINTPKDRYLGRTDKITIPLLELKAQELLQYNLGKADPKQEKEIADKLRRDKHRPKQAKPYEPPSTSVEAEQQPLPTLSGDKPEWDESYFGH